MSQGDGKEHNRRESDDDGGYDKGTPLRGRREGDVDNLR